MRSTVRLFRVRGIPVGVNWTWVLVFLLVFWSLGSVMFPATYPGRSGATYFSMALVATVLFFASILVHELSHAMRAVREGVRVGEITLWLFGGVSRAEEPLPDPGSQMRVVAAGPLASAGLGLGFLALTALATATGLPEAVRGVTDYLARINGLLLAFNLIPALPLDGGRILHALLWRRTDDRASATISAGRAGQAFGILLAAVGLVGLLSPGMGSVWLLFLGWFLFQAARQEVLAARVEQIVGKLRVRDVMAVDPVTLRPDMTIDEVTSDVARRRPHRAYPVLEDGQLVGLLPLREAAAARRDGGTLRVADVMLTGEEVLVVRPDDSAVDALHELLRHSGQAVVVDGTAGREVVGLLSVADVALALDIPPDLPVGTAAGSGRRDVRI